jgi:hypothetical protein
MVDVHIPEVMATGCFVSSTMVRDSEGDRNGRVGYRVYYRSATDSDLDRYQAEFAKKLQATHTLRYQNAFSARREILPVVTQF